MDKEILLSGGTNFVGQMIQSIHKYKVPLAIAFVAMLARTIFYFYVDRSWEDALITTLHAENFWKGGGLTHFHNNQPPIHGFTSPLSVLVPLFGEMFGEGRGLVFIKIVSIISSAFTVLYAFAICRHPKINLPMPLTLMAATYIALEYQQILWGMAGFETEIVTLILLMSCYYVIDDLEPNTRWLGITLGFAMLSRPDMFIWCALVGIYVFFRNQRAFYKVILIALAIYAPWLIFTQVYYGSFIPNTIFAKEFGFGGIPLPTGMADIFRGDRLAKIFAPLGPAFGGYGTGFQQFLDNGIISYILTGFAFLGAALLLIKRRNGAIGLALFFAAYTIYYLYFVPIIFGWYLAPINAVAIILAAIGINFAYSTMARSQKTFPLYVASVLYMISIVCVLPLCFKTEKQIQENIENNVRKEIGLYLKSAMKQTEIVSLEPLGYVAYYSGKDVYDTPGLANRKVVDFYKSLPRSERNLYNIVKNFYSDFVVLRPGNVSMEYGYFLQQKWFRTFYEADKAFVADENKLKQMWKSDSSYDKKFVVFKKRSVSGLIGKDGWIENSDWENEESKGLREPPAYPMRAAYALTYRGSDEGNKTLYSKPFALNGPSKIVMYLRVARSTDKISIAIEANNNEHMELKRSVTELGEWNLVTFDIASSDLYNTPIQIIVHDDSNIKENITTITQPFILSIDERVPEFENEVTDHTRKLGSDLFDAHEGWALGATYDKNYDKKPSPPNDRLDYIFGSRVDGDSNTGTILSRKIMVQEPGLKLLMYTTWGPVTKNLRLGIDTNDDGLIDIEAKDKGDGWRKFEVDLSNYVGREIRIIGIDNGNEWGEWLGFSQPVIYRAKQRP